MDQNLPKTEQIPDNHVHLDKVSLENGIKEMICNQSEVIIALEKAGTQIKIATNQIYKILSKSNHGRLIYSGAGTSARIGVQDGVELYPTFGWPKNRVKYIIAGGEKALLEPIENAEDDIILPVKLIKDLKLTKDDVVIGIAASGNTPFTVKVLKESRKLKTLTIAISNNPHGLIIQNSDYSIILDTGSEILVGSTRLKAGTAQKICLNIISTMLMAKLGKIKNGHMANMVTTNKKLRDRLKRMNTETRKRIV